MAAAVDLDAQSSWPYASLMLDRLLLLEPTAGARPPKLWQPEVACQAYYGRGTHASPWQSELAGRGAAVRGCLPGARWLRHAHLAGARRQGHARGVPYPIRMTSLERGRFFPTGFLPFLDVLVPVRTSFLSVETVSSFFPLFVQ
jgi:hypothetical protein